MKSNEEILQIVMAQKADYELKKKRKTQAVGAVFMASCITVGSVAIGTTYKKNHSTVNSSDVSQPYFTGKTVTSGITSEYKLTETTSVSSTSATVSTKKTNIEHSLSNNPNESFVLPAWDKLKDGQRYTTMNFNSAEYTVGRSAISKSYIGQKIGTAELVGQDYQTDKIYKKAITVYRLKNIYEKCAVGVTFDDGTSYAYVNANYMPKNLGQLITDLNLKRTLTFGEATYERHNNNQVKPIIFSEIKSDIVWSMLLNNENAVCESRDVPSDTIIFSIAANVDELGYKQMGLWITEQGYIGTNLLETGKYFYVGKDKANDFIDYAMKNFSHKQLDDITVYNEPIEE